METSAFKPFNMIGQRFCSYCGQRASTDPGQRFCQFCGKPFDTTATQTPYAAPPMMGNNDAQMPQPQATAMPSFTAYKANWWQDLASVIFFITLVGQFVLRKFFPELYYYFPDSTEYDVGIGRFVPLLMAGGAAFLLSGAKNSATRVALIIWIVVYVINGFFEFFPPEISSASSFEIQQAMYFVLGAVLVYAYSLIDQNNTMPASCRTWLNVLVIMGITSCILTFVMFVYVVFENYLVFTAIERIWYPSTSVFYMYLGLILQMCALWVLARSEVFSGPYDYRKSCNFSPLNRMMALTIIFPIVFSLLIFLLYKIGGEDLFTEILKDYGKW